MTERQNKQKSLIETAEEGKQAFLASMKALEAKMMARPHKKCEKCGDECPEMKGNGMCQPCYDRSLELAKLPKKTQEEELEEIMDIDGRYP